MVMFSTTFFFVYQNNYKYLYKNSEETDYLYFIIEFETILGLKPRSRLRWAGRRSGQLRPRCRPTSPTRSTSTRRRPTLTKSSRAELTTQTPSIGLKRKLSNDHIV